MICNVKLVGQKLGKRKFMVFLQREELHELTFNPAAIADAIDGWGTIYYTERVQIGQGKDFAHLYVTTSDLNMTASYLKRQIIAEQKVLDAMHRLKQREEA